MISSVFRKTKNAYTETFRNVFVYALFVCALVLLIPVTVQAEQIDSFIADIEVAKDATLTITEIIAYKFDDQRHGISRCILTKHADKASSIFKDRYFDVDVFSVRMDAQIVPYEVTQKRDEVCIKIGDPNSTITGEHTYEIVYTVGGAISYETYGGADLYWNVTGHDSKAPIRSVDARITSPDNIFLSERSCYRGVIGKTNSCQMFTDENGVIHFGGTLFSPTEGLTLAQALDRSKIATDIRERYKPILVGIVGAIVAIFVLGYSLYRYKTRFKTGRTIIPQYEPYPGIKPMYTGVLFDGRLDARDITACILYLAEQGYLKIKKGDKKVFFFFETDDYQVSIVKLLDDSVGHFERRVLGLLFKKIFFTDGKNQSSDSPGAVLLPSGEDPHDWPVGTSIWLSQIKNEKTNSIKIYTLKKDLEKDLVAAGFFQSIFRIDVAPTAGMSVLLLILYLFLALSFFFTVIIFVVFVVILSFQRRRTRKGYEALDHLKGFKEFLQVTEKQRYIFHNAPAKSPEQFMVYLPYAIAFGVEKEWAKTFESMTIPNPNWYDGDNGMHSFNSVSFANSFGGFSSFVAGATASGSSGGGASSGGGFSGGGSGGGGVGSW